MAPLPFSRIKKMGFASVGRNAIISDRASFYNCSHIALGNYVRIDDFSILSAGDGGIAIGNHIHIAAFSSLIGAGKITLSDFCNLSSRVSIYSSSDDYSGATMTNPMVDTKYTGVVRADVFLGKHVIIGTGSIVLPGVTLGEGVAVGALSLIREDCKAFGIYAGSPARFIKHRKRDLLRLEEDLLSHIEE